MTFIEKEDIRIADGPIGPFGPMHKCHLSQEETEHGKAARARNPLLVRTLIIGYNPVVYRHVDDPKARCAYCNWEVSDECQEWLDSLERRK
jgi:hypothetical protein